jgi:hypothetical protein
MLRALRTAFSVAAAWVAFAIPALAQETAPPAEKIANPIALFAGLDKVTGRIVAFEVQIDETVQFGALQVTPKVCHTRPASATPLTTGFIEVDEVLLDNRVRRIFSGWMFADSPSINAVEHPIYDVWLTDCLAQAGTMAAPPQ